MCIYIYIYIYIYTYYDIIQHNTIISLSLHIYIYIYIYTCIYLSMYVYIYTYIYIYICMYVCMYVYIYIYIYSCMRGARGGSTDTHGDERELRHFDHWSMSVVLLLVRVACYVLNIIPALLFLPLEQA